jgi:hypothetical protein
MNTERARDAMRALYPQRAQDIITVMNGYDESPLPAVSRGQRFVVAFAGSVYLDRDPTLVFRAAANLVRKLDLGPDAFGIELMGNMGRIRGESIEEIAQEEGIEAYVRVHPPGTPRQAAEFLARAHLLLNLAQDSDMAIPSKIFEYMRYDAWILALEPQGTATESVLRGTHADVVAPQDVDAITAVLEARFSAHAAGESPEPHPNKQRFSRRAQAALFFHALDAILESAK